METLISSADPWDGVELHSSECLRTIYSKREVREFSQKQVPDDVMNMILEAGRLSGSAKNRQPWDFIVVRDRERLRKLAAYGGHADHVAKASFAVVIVRRDDYVHDAFDAGRAAQNLMLAAHSLGVESCPATLQDQEGVKAFLGIPGDRYVQVAIAFGYPAEGAKRKGKVIRRGPEEVVHMERW